MEPPVGPGVEAAARREGEGVQRDAAAQARRHRARPVRGLPRRDGRRRPTPTSRRSRRCGCTSTRGAGPACRSTCARARTCRSRAPRCWSSSTAAAARVLEYEPTPHDTNYLRFRLDPEGRDRDRARARRRRATVSWARRSSSTSATTTRARCRRTSGCSATRCDGETLLFAREDGVEAAWRVVDRVLTDHEPAIPYPKHTWGPQEQDDLIDGPRQVAQPHRPTSTAETPPRADDRAPVAHAARPAGGRALLTGGPRRRLDRAGRPGRPRAGRHAGRRGHGSARRARRSPTSPPCSPTAARSWSDVARSTIFLIDLGEFPRGERVVRGGSRRTPSRAHDRGAWRRSRRRRASRSSAGPIGLSNGLGSCETNQHEPVPTKEG